MQQASGSLTTNHTAEFRTEKGVVFYDELLRATDPAKVTFEMDCGWVVVGARIPQTISRATPRDFRCCM